MVGFWFFLQRVVKSLFEHFELAKVRPVPRGSGFGSKAK